MPDGPSSPEPIRRFPGGGGSRRDTAARDRVLAATLALLADVGYADLTIEAIAARAGVGKPTVYRWWKNKAQVVYEASCTLAERDEIPATGDFARDLASFVDRVAHFFRRDGVVAALRGMLADTEVSRAMEQEHTGPARAHLRSLVDGARRARRHPAGRRSRRAVRPGGGSGDAPGARRSGGRRRRS